MGKREDELLSIFKKAPLGKRPKPQPRGQDWATRAWYSIPPGTRRWLDDLNLGIQQVENAAIYALPGIGMAGYGLLSDIYKTQDLFHGKKQFPATRGFISGYKHHIGQEIHDPEHHMGDIAVDLLTGVIPLVGWGIRGGIAAGEATAEAARVARAGRGATAVERGLAEAPMIPKRGELPERPNPLLPPGTRGPTKPKGGGGAPRGAGRPKKPWQPTQTREQKSQPLRAERDELEQQITALKAQRRPGIRGLRGRGSLELEIDKRTERIAEIDQQIADIAMPKRGEIASQIKDLQRGKGAAQAKLGLAQKQAKNEAATDAQRAHAQQQIPIHEKAISDIQAQIDKLESTLPPTVQQRSLEDLHQMLGNQQRLLDDWDEKVRHAEQQPDKASLHQLREGRNLQLQKVTDIQDQIANIESFLSDQEKARIAREAEKAHAASEREAAREAERAARQTEQERLRAEGEKVAPAGKAGVLVKLRYKQKTHRAAMVHLRKKWEAAKKDPNLSAGAKAEHKRRWLKSVSDLNKIDDEIEAMGGGRAREGGRKGGGVTGGVTTRRLPGAYEPVRITPTRVNNPTLSKRRIVEASAPMADGTRFGIYQEGPNRFRVAKITPDDTIEFTAKGSSYTDIANARTALHHTAKEHHYGQDLTIKYNRPANALKKHIEGGQVIPEPGTEAWRQMMQRQGTKRGAARAAAGRGAGAAPGTAPMMQILKAKRPERRPVVLSGKAEGVIDDPAKLEKFIEPIQKIDKKGKDIPVEGRILREVKKTGTIPRGVITLRISAGGGARIVQGNNYLRAAIELGLKDIPVVLERTRGRDRRAVAKIIGRVKGKKKSIEAEAMSRFGTHPPEGEAPFPKHDRTPAAGHPTESVKPVPKKLAPSQARTVDEIEEDILSWEKILKDEFKLNKNRENTPEEEMILDEIYSEIDDLKAELAHAITRDKEEAAKVKKAQQAIKKREENRKKVEEREKKAAERGHKPKGEPEMVAEGEAAAETPPAEPEKPAGAEKKKWDVYSTNKGVFKGLSARPNQLTAWAKKYGYEEPHFVEAGSEPPFLNTTQEKFIGSLKEHKVVTSKVVKVGAGKWELRLKVADDTTYVIPFKTKKAATAAEEQITAHLKDLREKKSQAAVEAARTEAEKKAAEPQEPKAEPEPPKEINPHEDTLYHGSPEGLIKDPDAYMHTRMWREGPGFYLTANKEKAAKYAKGKGKNAKPVKQGDLTEVTIKKGAKIVDLDAQPIKWWAKAISDLTGEKYTVEDFNKNSSHMESEPGMKGASTGIRNRMRTMYILTDYFEMPYTDAYYGFEEWLTNKYQVTKHMEGENPVWVVKDASVIKHVEEKPPEMGPPEMVGEEQPPKAEPEKPAKVEPEAPKETMSEKLDRLSAEKNQARKEWEFKKEERYKEVYKRLRNEDKKAGRDTSGKSVSDRQRRAYMEVARDKEIIALAERMDETELAYLDVQDPEKAARLREFNKKYKRDVEGAAAEATVEEAAAAEAAPEGAPEMVEPVEPKNVGGRPKKKPTEWEYSFTHIGLSEQMLEDAGVPLEGINAKGDFEHSFRRNIRQRIKYEMELAKTEGRAPNMDTIKNAFVLKLGEEKGAEVFQNWKELSAELRRTAVPRKKKTPDQQATPQNTESGATTPAAAAAEGNQWAIIHKGPDGDDKSGMVIANSKEEALAQAKAEGMVDPKVVEDISSPEGQMLTGTLRQQGLSPAQLGTNPRKLARYGVPPGKYSEVQAAVLNVTIKAREANVTRKNVDVRKALQGVLGKELGLEVYHRWLTIGGHSPATMNDVVSAFMRTLLEPKRMRGGTYIIGTKTVGEKGQEQLIPIPVVKSYSPWVRAWQHFRYQTAAQMLDDPTIWTKYKATMLRASEGAMKKKVEKEFLKLDRFRKDMELAAEKYTLSKKEVRALERKWRAAQKAAFKANRKEMNFGDWVMATLDTSQQLAVIGTLYLRPAYIPPNLMGQMLLLAMDHSWNPWSMAQTSKLAWDYHRYDPGAQHLIRAIMQNTQGNALLQTSKEMVLPGASYSVARGNQMIAGAFSKLLDNPWRDHVFFKELHRQGFRDNESIYTLLHDERMFGKLYEISQRANANIIDFSMYTNFEKNVLRRLIFFYPWIKGSTKYTVRFPAVHPVQAATYTEFAREAKERLNKQLGVIPTYLEGAFVVGSRTIPGVGKMPLVINPSSVTIFGSMVDIMKSTQVVVTGKGSTADLPASQFFSPAVQALVAATEGHDVFTGKQYPPGTSYLGAAAEKYAGNIALYRLYKQIEKSRAIERGDIKAEKVLYPYSTSEAAGRYFVGTYPFAVNLKEARSRALAEQRSLLSPTEREKFKGQQETDQFLKFAKEEGIPVPGEVKALLNMRAARAVNRKAWEGRLGKLDARARVVADMSFLVENGKMSQSEAKSYLLSWANSTESEWNRLDSMLGRLFFGNSMISRYKTTINKYRDFERKPLIGSSLTGE